MVELLPRRSGAALPAIASYETLLHDQTEAALRLIEEELGLRRVMLVAADEPLPTQEHVDLPLVRDGVEWAVLRVIGPDAGRKVANPAVRSLITRLVLDGMVADVGGVEAGGSSRGVVRVGDRLGPGRPTRGGGNTSCRDGPRVHARRALPVGQHLARSADVVGGATDPVVGSAGRGGTRDHRARSRRRLRGIGGGAAALEGAWWTRGRRRHGIRVRQPPSRAAPRAGD